MSFFSSKDIVGPVSARRYLRSRARDAVACWASFSQQQRDEMHVIAFAQYLARHW